MKQVILMCHGQVVDPPPRGFCAQDAQLSAEGVAAARAAATILRDRPTAVVASSNYVCAAGTLMELSRDSVYAQIEACLGPEPGADTHLEVPSRWAPVEALDWDRSRIFEACEGFLRAEAIRLAGAVHFYAGRIGPGQRALLVTHPLLADLAIAAVTGTWPPATELQPAQLCELTFDGERPVTARVLSVTP